jgi:archaellum biogenesis protein FlaJ (TadC family)
MIATALLTLWTVFESLAPVIFISRISHYYRSSMLPIALIPPYIVHMFFSSSVTKFIFGGHFNSDFYYSVKAFSIAGYIIVLLMLMLWKKDSLWRF